mmetsp:Transcript_10218/g.33469  ORF Transcript_10218/g.33469 Transcript_10218/m.33469 type:complete len:203 (-) Transcript_10218:3835-4443(-)
MVRRRFCAMNVSSSSSSSSSSSALRRFASSVSRVSAALRKLARERPRRMRFKRSLSSSSSSTLTMRCGSCQTSSPCSSSSGSFPSHSASWCRMRRAGMCFGKSIGFIAVRHASRPSSATSVCIPVVSDASPFTSLNASQMMARRKLSMIISTRMLYDQNHKMPGTRSQPWRLLRSPLTPISPRRISKHVDAASPGVENFSMP